MTTRELYHKREGFANFRDVDLEQLFGALRAGFWRWTSLFSRCPKNKLTSPALADARLFNHKNLWPVPGTLVNAREDPKNSAVSFHLPMIYSAMNNND